MIVKHFKLVSVMGLLFLFVNNVELQREKFCQPVIQNIGNIFSLILGFIENSNLKKKKKWNFERSSVAKGFFVAKFHIYYYTGLNDFPELPLEFQTRVEINLLDQNRSMEVLLLYDRYDKNGEITFRDRNYRLIQRFKFNDNEILTIRDDQCEVKKLNESNDDNLFFGVEPDDAGINMKPPTYLFHFNNGYPHVII
jgi:hypothetical protein